MARRPERPTAAASTGLDAIRPRDLASSTRAVAGGPLSGHPRVLLYLLALTAIPILAINFWGLTEMFRWLLSNGGRGGDWFHLLRLAATDPYATELYRWSPPAAWIWSTLILPIGLPAWWLAHLVALAAIRDWRVIAVTLLSWAFWHDFVNGNVMTFVFASAWCALRGSRTGTVAFLALCVLIPRPLMLPVLAWLLYRRPEARVWFGTFAVLVIALSLAAGQMDDWVARLVVTGRIELESIWNIGPSRLLGVAWVPLGAALALLLTWKGWIGVASVTISPYLFPNHMMMGLLDLPRILDRRPQERVDVSHEHVFP